MDKSLNLKDYAKCMVSESVKVCKFYADQIDTETTCLIEAMKRSELEECIIITENL